MKTTMILSSAALFFAGALAAPAPLVFKVQLANDQSGKNANVDVPVDGVTRTFGQLWGGVFGTPVIATSLQAVSPGAGGNNVMCVVTDPAKPGLSMPLNARNTFIDLDGQVGKAVPTDVTGFTINCKL